MRGGEGLELILAYQESSLFVTFRSVRLAYAAQSHFTLQYKALFR